MLYAINNNGDKVRPNKTGERAIDPFCKLPVLSKCGENYIHHWAFIEKPVGVNYKPMTQWHYEWQLHFNKESVEIRVDNNIADVKTEGGTVIEFQNSPISLENIKQREQTYGKSMVWVLNGSEYGIKIKNTNQIYSLYLTETFSNGRHDDTIYDGLVYKRRNVILKEVGEKNVALYDIDDEDLFDRCKHEKVVLNFTSRKDDFAVEFATSLKINQKLKERYLKPTKLLPLNKLETEIYLKTRKAFFRYSNRAILIDLGDSRLYDYRNDVIISKSEFIYKIVNQEGYISELSKDITNSSIICNTTINKVIETKLITIE